MEVGKPSLSGLLSLERILMIPLFQRRYVWGRDEWNQLWEDVASLEGEGDNLPPYFMGPVVLARINRDSKHIPSCQVIDGQQRLLTFSILLCAIRDVASYPEINDEKTAKRIEKYLINSDEEGNPGRYKVHPRYWDSEVFFGLVDGEKIDKRRKIAKAHRHFVNLIKQEGETPEETGEFCCQLLNILRGERLQFVDITLNEEENPYAIFRSLNFSGVDLRAGDLIRNHVFMALPDKIQQQKFDEHHWRKLESFFQEKGNFKDEEFERFFRACLLRKGEYRRKSDTYVAFSEAHPEEDIKRNSTGLTNEYCRLARHWQQIKDDKDAAHCVGELSIGVAYPLVMRILEMCENKDISDSDAAESFRLISGFFLRRHICGKNSRTYDKWFCEMCRSETLGQNPLANLKNSLVTQKGGWPENDEFKSAFINFDLYESRYCSAVLRRMEKEMQKTNRPPDPINLERCWVEHVMPQSIGDDSNGREWKKDLSNEWERIQGEWMHTPGNLTLIGSEYNQEMSNRSFSCKKPKLSESNIRLNGDFASVENWSEAEIKARGEKLAELAAKIWCGPDGS